MKTCNKCSIELILGENITPSTYKNQDYICKSCNAQKMKKYYINNHQTAVNAMNRWKSKIQGVYGIFEDGVCLYVGESRILNNRISAHKTYIKNPEGSGRRKDFYYNLSSHSRYTIGIIEETPNHKERETYYINKLKPLYNE